MKGSASGAGAKGHTMYEVRVAGPDDVHTHADELSALRHANQINQTFLADLLKHPDPADMVLCVATVHGEATGNNLLAEIARLHARVERLRGLCKSASGWLLDAGDTVNSDTILELVSDMEAPSGMDEARLRAALAGLVSVVESINGNLSEKAWQALEDARHALGLTFEVSRNQRRHGRPSNKQMPTAAGCRPRPRS